jgi:hypothetical protein
MYVYLTNDLKVKQHEIPLYTKQYESYKYVFKKINVNMLPKDWSYDCTIDLEKGIWLAFEPYNLSQYELNCFSHLLYHSLDVFFHLGFVTYSSS